MSSAAVRARPCLQQYRRNMAHSARRFSTCSASFSMNRSNEFLVVVPDFPKTTSARAKAQPEHIKNAMPLINAGKITYFGVTLTNHPADNDLSRNHSCINGSTIVMRAEDEIEVMKFLEQDAYAEAGVWNVKDARIWPFKSG